MFIPFDKKWSAGWITAADLVLAALRIGRGAKPGTFAARAKLAAAERHYAAIMKLGTEDLGAEVAKITQSIAEGLTNPGSRPLSCEEY